MFDKMFDWWKGLHNKSIKVGVAVFFISVGSTYYALDIVNQIKSSIVRYEQKQDAKLDALIEKVDKSIAHAATELAVTHVELLFATAISEEQYMNVVYKMSGKLPNGTTDPKGKRHSGEGDIRLACKYGIMNNVVFDKRLAHKICLANRTT